MTKKDGTWVVSFFSIVAFLINPGTHGLFMAATKAHPYVMGFLKFGILATMGELLGVRIRKGRFQKPSGLGYRILFWGALGMVSVLAFEIFSGGVASGIKKGLLPLGESMGFAGRLVGAFYTSALLNLMFGPTMMAFHRFFDTLLDLSEGRVSQMRRHTMPKVFEAANWPAFTDFVLLRAIPLFWIPAHTITFMLPPEYRVLMAAFLSIALGCILAVGQKNGAEKAAA